MLLKTGTTIADIQNAELSALHGGMSSRRYGMCDTQEPDAPALGGAESSMYITCYPRPASYVAVPRSGRARGRKMPDAKSGRGILA
jgi:hypothetical protein